MFVNYRLRHVPKVSSTIFCRWQGTYRSHLPQCQKSWVDKMAKTVAFLMLSSYQHINRQLLFCHNLNISLLSPVMQDLVPLHPLVDCSFHNYYYATMITIDDSTSRWPLPACMSVCTSGRYNSIFLIYILYIHIYLGCKENYISRIVTIETNKGFRNFFFLF